jgi:hypothetical protein
MNSKESPTERIIGQLSYVSDELELLMGFVNQIDESVVVQKPISGEPSILENFQQMVRDQESLSRDIGLTAFGFSEEIESDLESVLKRFKDGRDALVTFVKGHHEWSVAPVSNHLPLAARLHELILAEASRMRDVTVRLHESNLFRL